MHGGLGLGHERIPSQRPLAETHPTPETWCSQPAVGIWGQRWALVLMASIFWALGEIMGVARVMRQVEEAAVASTHPPFLFPASYPVPGVGPHCHGNPSILAYRPLVAHRRCWPLLHLAAIAVGKRLHFKSISSEHKGRVIWRITYHSGSQEAAQTASSGICFSLL